MTLPTPETHAYLGMFRPPWETVTKKLSDAYDKFVTERQITVYIETTFGPVEMWNQWIYSCNREQVAEEQHRRYYMNDARKQMMQLYTDGWFDVPQYKELPQ